MHGIESLKLDRKLFPDDSTPLLLIQSETLKKDELFELI